MEKLIAYGFQGETTKHSQSTMNSAHSCSICGDACKSIRACRSLRIPPEGFYSGGGGGHTHDDDCEEESLLIAHPLNAHPLIAHQPFVQTYSQGDGIPPTRLMQV